MLYSREDAIGLLARCKEEGSSLRALAYFATKERFEFSCKVERVSAEEIVLLGTFAVVAIPLEESATFDYSETQEMPAQMQDVLRRLDYCLTIQTPRVKVVLAIARPLI